MTTYNGMLLRSTAERAGLDSVRFDTLLEFVEWTGLQVPAMALERARNLETQLPLLPRTHEALSDYMWCRLSLETAIRYQHSSGDAVVRLVFAALVDEDPPPVLQLTTFERSLPHVMRGNPVVVAAKQLRRTPEWQYVSAFTNTLKHMNVVDYHHHVIVGESSGFAFRQFDYKGRTYSDCSQSEFERILDFVSNRIFFDILGALMGELEARAQ